jgi:hypothetical protein
MEGAAGVAGPGFEGQWRSRGLGVRTLHLPRNSFTARSSSGRTAAPHAADAGSSPARVTNGRSCAPRSVLWASWPAVDNTQGKPACGLPEHDVIQCAPCEVAQRKSGWPLSTVAGGSNPPFAASRDRRAGCGSLLSWSNGTTAPRHGADGSSRLLDRTHGSEALRAERPAETGEGAVRARLEPPTRTCSSNCRAALSHVDGGRVGTSHFHTGLEPAGTAPP